MMVIRGEPATAIGSIAAGTVGIFPADRCVWTQGTVNNSQGYQDNYTVVSAEFVAGNATYVALTNPELGYIGKTGRFVGMTV